MKAETIEVCGWKGAIYGMRAPKRSWSRSDSTFDDGNISLGENDLKLAKTLAAAGAEHRKFMRMIHAQVLLEVPLIIAVELDTYKVGTTRNSCSLQHTGSIRDFTIGDFSINDKVDVEKMNEILYEINRLRRKYVETKDYSYFVAMRQIIPSSFLYNFVLDLNYETCYNIYSQRKNHPLLNAGWGVIINWIEHLPYFKEITMLNLDKNN